MLMLKGNCRKSSFVEVLMDKTNSICFVYHDYPLVYNSICVDSLKYSLEDLKECILDEFKASCDKHHTYMIIYTNKKEEDLEDFIRWLDNYNWCYFCEDIIVTCK